MKLYQDMLDAGIAKECARNVLPLCVGTKMYMTGNLRNWIHYIELRSANGTQKEHQDIALLAKQHFICQFPTISEALGWCSEEEDCGCDDDYADCLQPSLRID
jgi:thymidylate synthase (FAD)